MKPKLICATAALFVSLCANAQSSVTMYGLLSQAVDYTNNVGGGRLVQVLNGLGSLSRIGFKGTEDLGGGDSAFFVLEAGITPDTGTAGSGTRFFNRASVVGLSSTSLGSLWLGRQDDVMTDALCSFESACQFPGFGAHVGDNDNVFTTFRVNNAITYKSPSLKGLQIAAQYGMPETTTNSKNNMAYSGSAKYVMGDFSVGMALVSADQPNSATNGSGAVNGDYGYSSPFVTSRLSGAAVLQQRAEGIGGSYKLLGDGQLSVIYTRSKFSYLDGADVHIRNAEISFTKFVMPTLLAGVGFFNTKANYSNNLPNWSWNELNLGLDYFVSKRTDLFAAYMRQQAIGAGNTAWIYASGRSSGATQTNFGVGIRHRF